jgi:hypothetical protein
MTSRAQPESCLTTDLQTTEFKAAKDSDALSRRRESVGMSASRRLASQAERDTESNAKALRDMVEELNACPLAKRKFLHIATTSNAVQVVWSHPEELNPYDKKHLTYELQYGVGSKVNRVE